WTEPVESLTSIASGEVSATFSFCSAGSEFILRIGYRPENYEKDRLSFNRLRGSGVPVPRVLSISRIGELSVCISERLPGTLYCDLPISEQRTRATQLLNALTLIHSVDISDTSGYGDWGMDLDGCSESGGRHLAETIRVLQCDAETDGDIQMR